jgi:hypothetical protein
MKHVFCKVGLATVAIVAVTWFTHGFKSETIEPRKMPTTSVRRASPSASAAGDFISRFHAAASENDCIRRDAGLRAIAGRWIGANPEEALDFVRRLPGGATKDTFLRQLLVAWTERDAAAAMAWADRLPATAERRAAFTTVSTALATSDPRSALELAIRHGADEDETGGLLENLAMQWAERETSAALEWVGTQPNGEWRDRLIGRVAFILSKSDPCRAACHVAERMEPGPMQDEAAISVLHQWAMIDSESAARWVEGFTAGTLRERALGELAGWKIRNGNQDD